MGFSRSNKAPSTPRIECEDCSQVPYNNNNSEIDLGRGWKKKRKKKVMHATPRPANRRLVTTCFWWFCSHTQQIRNRSCVYHRWSLLLVLWTSGGLEQFEFSNCIRPGCILKPPSDSLETSMACADMFMELKRFPIQISCMTQITAGRTTKYTATDTDFVCPELSCWCSDGELRLSEGS